MARNKATTTDIHARLAKSECANFSNNKCHGTTPCLIVNGEECVYFTTYVQPLLNYQEIAAKFHNEAKILVALNPKSKIVRKRRQAGEPKLALDANAPKEVTPKIATPKAIAPKVVKPKIAPAKLAPVTAINNTPAAVVTIPESPAIATPPVAVITIPEPPAPLTIANIAPPKAPEITAEEPFFLELTPYEPTKRKSGRRR